MKEEWKDIPGFDGAYQISNKGRVRSWKGVNQYSERRKRPKVLNQKMRNGYLALDLYHNGRHNHLSVHRLVAKVFVANPKNKPEVNHKDGCKTHNISENLEWCTSSENQQHSFDNGLQDCSGENNGHSKLTENDVIKIKKMLSEGVMTQKEIAKTVGISRVTITNINNRKTWRHV